MNSLHRWNRSSSPMIRSSIFLPSIVLVEYLPGLACSDRETISSWLIWGRIVCFIASTVGVGSSSHLSPLRKVEPRKDAGLKDHNPEFRRTLGSPVEALHEMLVVSRHSGNSSSQLVCWRMTKALNVSSTIQFIRSAWPSVWGWFVEPI